MTRPDLRTYVFGNPVSFALAALLALYSGCEAYLGLINPLPFLLLCGLALYSYSANTRLRDYQAWRREWDLLSGAPPRRWRWGSARNVIFGLTIWVILAASLTADTADPVGSPWVWAMWGGLAVAGALALRRALPRRAKHKLAKPVHVTVCLPRPSSSPSVAEAMDALPEHCRQIMGME